MTIVAVGFASTTMSSSDAASEVNGTAHNRAQVSRAVYLIIEWMLRKEPAGNVTNDGDSTPRDDRMRDDRMRELPPRVGSNATVERLRLELAGSRQS